MGQCRSPSVSPSKQAASSAATPTQEELSLFQQYVQEGNPFEMHIEHKEEETEDVLASNGVSASTVCHTQSIVFPYVDCLCIISAGSVKLFINTRQILYTHLKKYV